MPLVLNANTSYDDDGKIRGGKFVNYRLGKHCELQGLKERLMTDDEWEEYIGKGGEGISLEDLEAKRKTFVPSDDGSHGVGSWENREYIYDDEVDLFLGFRPADIVQYKTDNKTNWDVIAKQAGWTTPQLRRLLDRRNRTYNKYLLLSLKRWWSSVHH